MIPIKTHNVFVFFLLLALILFPASPATSGNLPDAGAFSEKVRISSEILENPSENVKVIITLKDKTVFKNKGVRASGAEIASSDDIENEIKSFGGKVKYKYTIINGVAATVPKSALLSIANNPNVIFIEEDKVVHAFLTESVPLISANSAWNIQSSGVNFTGSGETVCILDTGVNYNHTDLGGGFGAGYKVVGGYDYVNNDNDPMDDNGHGTHVAGIVAANGTLKGVAPGAKIVAMKVLGASGAGDFSDVIQAINDCNANRTVYNISVISMSLGTTGVYNSACDSSDSGVSGAINSSVGNNITVLAASGNGAHTNGIALPACMINAIPVGATYDANLGTIGFTSCTESNATKDNMVTCFTDRSANFPNMLLAPGGAINSTYLSPSYAIEYGTSQATPHAAGAAAILIQANKALNGAILTPAQVRSTLKTKGKAIDDSGTSTTFYRINVFASVLSLDNKAPVISFISISPNYTKSNPTLNASAYDLINNISYAEYYVDSNASIFNMTASDGAFDSKNESFFSQVNITALSDGSHTAYVKAFDANGNSNISGVSFTVDRAAPNVVLNSAPQNNLNTSVRLQVFNFTAVDNLDSTMSCILYVNAGSANSTSASNNTAAVMTYNFTIDGTYSWNITCADDASNLNSSAVRIITVDTAKPNVSITSPGNNSNVVDNTPEVSFIITDNIDSNTSYVLYADGVANIGGSAPNNTNVSVNMTLLSNGIHVLIVQATDDAGNAANSTPVTIVINAAAPLIMLNSPFDNYNTTSQNISFNFTAIDNITSIISCSLIINGTVNATNSSVSNSTETIFEIFGFSDGTRAWSINCTNGAGYSNASSVRIFTVDSTAPSVNIALPQNISYNSVSRTLNYTVSDAGVGLDTCWYSYNGTNNTLAGCGNASFTAPDNQQSTLILYANDTLNNVDLASVTFTVDTSAPVVNPLSPDNNYNSSNSSVNFSFTPIDNLAPVMSCSLLINGAVNAVNNSVVNSTTTTFVVYNISDGAKAWNVNCTDSANNSGASAARNLLVDTKAPAVVLNSAPQNNLNTSVRLQVFNFTAVDNLDSTMSCILYVNAGSANSTSASNNTAAVMTYNFTIDGTYSWNITCADDASNLNSSAVRTLSVDTVSPLISYANGTEANNTILKRNWVFVNATSFDINLKNVTFFLYNSTNLLNSTTYQATYSNYTQSINFTGLKSEAEYRFNASAQDYAGNENHTETYFVILDNTAPRISSGFIRQTIIYAAENLTINATIEDMLNLTSYAVIYYNGSVAGNISLQKSGQYYIAVFSNTSSKGNYSINITATDYAGNSATGNPEFFEAKEPVIAGILPEMFNSTGNISIVFFNQNSTYSSVVEGNGSSNLTVSTGLYNVNITPNITGKVVIENLNMTLNTTIAVKYKEVNNSAFSGMQPQHVFFKGNPFAFEIETQSNWSMAKVCFNWTNISANISKSSIYRCKWNFTAGACESPAQLEKLTSYMENGSSGTFLCAGVFNFSAFVPGEMQPYCGDGIIDAGEQCDGGSGCSSVCTIISSLPPGGPSGGGGGVGELPNITSNVSNVSNATIESNITYENITDESGRKEPSDGFEDRKYQNISDGSLNKSEASKDAGFKYNYYLLAFLAILIVILCALFYIVRTKHININI